MREDFPIVLMRDAAGMYVNLAMVSEEIENLMHICKHIKAIQLSSHPLMLHVFNRTLARVSHPHSFACQTMCIPHVRKLIQFRYEQLLGKPAVVSNRHMGQERVRLESNRHRWDPTDRAA